MPETNPILQSLYARKSVRVFEEKAIPAGMKQAILEAAAQAESWSKHPISLSIKTA